MSAAVFSEAELQAYVDERLPAARHAAVEAFLALHPEEARRLEAYRAQKRELQAAFAPLLSEPIPERLRAAAVQPPATARRHALSPWSLQRFAAALAIACLGGIVGWVVRDQAGPERLALQATERTAPGVPIASLPRLAAVAHAVFSPDVRRPVEVTAEQEEQLVAWLTKRIGSSVRPPRLGTLGYELVGGRLLPGGSGPVAQFMYQDGSGQRLTLYASTEHAGNRETAFRFAQEGRISVFYWIDGSFGYALSAEIAKDELARIATAVYDQLQPR